MCTSRTFQLICRGSDNAVTLSRTATNPWAWSSNIASPCKLPHKLEYLENVRPFDLICTQLRRPRQALHRRSQFFNCNLVQVPYSQRYLSGHKNLERWITSTLRTILACHARMSSLDVRWDMLISSMEMLNLFRYKCSYIRFRIRYRKARRGRTSEYKGITHN